MYRKSRPNWNGVLEYVLFTVLSCIVFYLLMIITIPVKFDVYFFQFRPLMWIFMTLFILSPIFWLIYVILGYDVFQNSELSKRLYSYNRSNKVLGLRKVRITDLK